MKIVETLEVILPSAKQIAKLLQDRGNKSQLSVKSLSTGPNLKAGHFFDAQSSKQLSSTA